MTKLVLYFFPGACSRVTINALEEAGVAFEGRPINLFRGEQKSPEYQAINPKGKVPALFVDGQRLTENVAILSYLNRHYPAAHLLPVEGESGLPQGVSDLAWIASTLHPLVRQIRGPARYAANHADEVKAAGVTALSQELDVIAAHLAEHPWWYGDSWSIVDVYLYWIHFAVEPVGFSIAPWPSLAQHAERVRARPAFARALAREKAAAEAIGMDLPPSF